MLIGHSVSRVRACHPDLTRPFGWRRGCFNVIYLGNPFGNRFLRKESSFLLHEWYEVELAMCWEPERGVKI